MKERIAIIELETHANIILQWHSILKESELLDYHFFLHSNLKNKTSLIPEERIKYINNVNEFLSNANFDLVIVNTYHRYFKAYLKIFKAYKTLTIVHNVNFSVLHKPVSLLNLKNEKQWVLYYIKLYIKELIGIRRKEIKHSNYLAVLSKNLTENKNLNLKTLQLNYNVNASKLQAKDILKIVIPGTVSSKRKDLKLVFKVMKTIKPKFKLEFIFLGKPANNSVKKALQSLKQNTNLSIRFFKDFVDQKTYNNIIIQADVLFCPVKIKTSFYWVTEHYGKTKVSGNELDCIKYGKFGVFPENYPKFNWPTFNYKNEDELVMFFNTLDFNVLKTYTQKLNNSTKIYNYLEIKKTLENQLLTIING